MTTTCFAQICRLLGLTVDQNHPYRCWTQCGNGVEVSPASTPKAAYYDLREVARNAVQAKRDLDDCDDPRQCPAHLRQQLENSLRNWAFR